MPQRHGMDVCMSLILVLEMAPNITGIWFEILHKENLTWQLGVILKDLAHS